MDIKYDTMEFNQTTQDLKVDSKHCFKVCHYYYFIIYVILVFDDYSAEWVFVYSGVCLAKETGFMLVFYFI